MFKPKFMKHTMRELAAVAIGLFVVALVGCSSNPTHCATAETNFVTSAGCIVGGGYDAALEAQRIEIDRLQDQIQFTRDELIAIDRRAKQLAGDVASYRAEIDSRDQELAQLRAEIAKLSPEVKAKNMEKSTLMSEVDAMRALLADARKQLEPDEGRIRVLTLEVERRKRVIENLMKAVVVE